MEGAQPEAAQGRVRVHRVPQLLREGEVGVPRMLRNRIGQQQGVAAKARIESSVGPNVPRPNSAENVT